MTAKRIEQDFFRRELFQKLCQRATIKCTISMEFADCSQLESADSRIQLLEGAVFGGQPTEIMITERFVNSRIGKHRV
jgi:hypothetical protein